MNNQNEDHNSRELLIKSIMSLAGKLKAPVSLNTMTIEDLTRVKNDLVKIRRGQTGVDPSNN